MGSDSLKESIMIRVPHGTQRQARIAAQNMDMNTEDLLRTLILKCLNAITGTPRAADIIQVIPGDVRAKAKKEVEEAKQEVARIERLRSRACDQVTRLQREIQGKLEEICRTLNG